MELKILEEIYDSYKNKTVLNTDCRDSRTRSKNIPGDKKREEQYWNLKRLIRNRAEDVRNRKMAYN